MSNPRNQHGLTERQENYCNLAASGTYADAYREAYNPSDTYNFHEDIRRLNKNPVVARRILDIQMERAKNNPIKITGDWLLTWWLQRLLYDPAEITTWAKHACRHCHGEGHQYQWREMEYLQELDDAIVAKAERLPDCGGGFGYSTRRAPVDDCPMCDGRGLAREDFADTRDLSPMARAAFEGVKRTKDGIELKMADKQVAAQWVAKLTGFDVQTVRIIDELPTPAALQGIADNPVALAEAYKRAMSGGATKH